MSNIQKNYTLSCLHKMFERVPFKSNILGYKIEQRINYQSS